MSLAGKHVVITGAASGIGRATALESLAHGARVTSLDLVDPQIDNITHIGCDISNPDHWADAAARIGEIHHLFLNAGVMSAPPDASAENYSFFNVSTETYRRVTGVNVDGVVFGLRSLVPGMSSGSSIVVTASLAGLHQYSHDPLYALTKHAVVGLARSLAPSLATRGIRINTICPNRVDTPMLPDEMRSLDHLSAPSVAADVLHLFSVDTNGGIWTRTHENTPLALANDGPTRSRLNRRVRSLFRRAVFSR